MAALKISVLIFTLLVLVTSIINIIYYSNASKGNCSGISAGFATFMMWVNIIFLVITVGIFIWAMIRLFRKKPKEVKVQAVSPPPTSQGTAKPPSKPVSQQAYRRTTTIEEPVSDVSIVRTPQEEADRRAISNVLGQQLAFE